MGFLIIYLFKVVDNLFKNQCLCVVYIRQSLQIIAKLLYEFLPYLFIYLFILYSYFHNERQVIYLAIYLILFDYLLKKISVNTFSLLPLNYYSTNV